MDVADIRKLNAEEMQAELIKQRREQFNLRMQRASGQLGQTHLLQETRRTIARIKTVMAESAETGVSTDGASE